MLIPQENGVSKNPHLAQFSCPQENSTPCNGIPVGLDTPPLVLTTRKPAHPKTVGGH